MGVPNYLDDQKWYNILNKTENHKVTFKTVNDILRSLSNAKDKVRYFRIK